MEFLKSIIDAINQQEYLEGDFKAIIELTPE